MPDAAGAQMLRLRQQLLDRVWLGLMLLAAVGTPASVARALTTGWMPLYTAHVCLAAFIFTMYALRRRLSFTQRSFIVLGILVLLGTAGLLTLGMLGGGFWWLAAAVLLAGTLYSHRVGLAMAVAASALIAVAAVLFTQGVLTLQVDPAAYVYAATSWIAFLLVASIMPLVLFQSIALFQGSTVELLEQVERQRSEIERLARHDALTGLVRWDVAVDRLQAALDPAASRSNKVGVLFVDLDGFKAVNDSLGHEAGDRVLQVVAERLAGTLRPGDIAARIGGDEFILILTNVQGTADAQQVAERAISAVATPIALPSGSVSVSASIGIALYPDHATDAKGLRRCADAAMYAAKSAGKNRAALGAAAQV